MKLPYRVHEGENLGNTEQRKAGKLKSIVVDSTLGLMLGTHFANLDAQVLNKQDEGRLKNRCFPIGDLAIEGASLNGTGSVHMIFGENVAHCVIAGIAIERVVINYETGMTWRELAWRLNGYARYRIDVIWEAAREAGAPFPGHEEDPNPPAPEPEPGPNYIERLSSKSPPPIQASSPMPGPSDGKRELPVLLHV